MAITNKTIDETAQDDDDLGAYVQSLRKSKLAKSGKKPSGSKPNAKKQFKVSIKPVHVVTSYDISIDASNGRQIVNLTKEQIRELSGDLQELLDTLDT